MDERLTLNDGTALEGGSAILIRDLLLYMPGQTMARAFHLLADAAKTRRIVYTENNGDEKAFDGYVQLVALSDEGNGLITAVMRKAVA